MKYYLLVEGNYFFLPQILLPGKMMENERAELIIRQLPFTEAKRPAFSRCVECSERGASTIIRKFMRSS